jgi:hypothetical protein
MRGLSQRTIELILFARLLLEQYNPMTLRQLHYAIFSAAIIEYLNTQADYKRLSRATTAARRLHRRFELADFLYAAPKYAIPGDWIVDETREPEVVNMWSDISGYLDTVKRAYRRDYWQDQPHYCEVWSEKGTVLGSLRPIVSELGVTVRVCHGFGSTGMESQIGDLFENIEKDITVFYLGDHDPSGHDIERDIYQRAQNASGRDFNLVRLAIHPEDIGMYNLPPQRIKSTDSRAKGFQQRFGTLAATVELDALPVDVLRGRVKNSVERLIDKQLWKRQTDVEAAELACIADYADRIKNLPQLPR